MNKTALSDRMVEQFPLGGMTFALIGYLLVRCEKKKGLRSVRAARAILQNELVRAQIVRLRAPKVEQETLDLMDAGVKFFDDVLAVALARWSREDI